jgi:hypothetical protein
VITTSFRIDELEEAKPRIASRLVDSMVVDWEPIEAPIYQDQRRDTSGSGTAGGRPSRGRQGPRRP